jgi:hypothetical protein
LYTKEMMSTKDICEKLTTNDPLSTCLEVMMLARSKQHTFSILTQFIYCVVYKGDDEH